MERNEMFIYTIYDIHINFLAFFSYLMLNMIFLVKFSCFFVCSGISSYNLYIHLLIYYVLCLIYHFSFFVAIFSLNELEGQSLNLFFLLIMVTLSMLLRWFFSEIVVNSIELHFLFLILKLKS